MGAMELDRLNPVTLITGAASPMGGACARTLARKSQGGLILVDLEEAALDAAADAVETPPERVSTLAFDVADEARWTQASGFIRAQYGRLDWAVVNAGAAHKMSITDDNLVEWKRATNFDAAQLSLRALMPLMRANAQGGAIIVTAPSPAPDLTRLVQEAAREGASGNIRVNALTRGGVDMRRDAPLFQDLERARGGERAALEDIARLNPPLARYAADDDFGRLVTLLLADESPLTGATLVVDGGYTL